VNGESGAADRWNEFIKFVVGAGVRADGNGHVVFTFDRAPTCAIIKYKSALDFCLLHPVRAANSAGCLHLYRNLKHISQVFQHVY
jgi:hypothetical protein